MEVWDVIVGNIDAARPSEVGASRVRLSHSGHDAALITGYSIDLVEYEAPDA
ncbi:hypothetical protein D3C80_2157870 [compost metagenome]